MPVTSIQLIVLFTSLINPTDLRSNSSFSYKRGILKYSTLSVELSISPFSTASLRFVHLELSRQVRLPL